MTFKVFLDVNVLLDFLLKREGISPAQSILKLAEKQQIELHISIAILQTSAYFLQKYYGTEVAKKLLIELLLIVKLVDSDEDIVIQALNSSISDIEDAIHYYTAMKHDMHYLITGDVAFQKVSHRDLEVINPERFLKIFN